MIKAIIFDCFGVLAEDGWTPFKRKHIEPDVNLTKEIARLGALTDKGVLSNEETIKEMARLIRVPVDELRHALERKVPNEELFSFIRSDLKRHYKIGLLSNANYDVVNELFLMEHARLFDAHVLSYETKLLKPDKRMFQLAADRLGVQMSDCIYIDDKQQHVDAAANYGMHALLYTSLESLIKELHKLF